MTALAHDLWLIRRKSHTKSVSDTSEALISRPQFSIVRENIRHEQAHILANQGSNQNHHSSALNWRQGIAPRLGCERLNGGKRRALSLSIRALKPYPINADLSFTPVGSNALAYKSSSIFSLALLLDLHGHQSKHQCMTIMMPRPEGMKANRGARP